MNTPKLIAALAMLISITLIGLSALVLSGRFGPPSALSVAIHMACILVNIVCGFFNLRKLLRRSSSGTPPPATEIPTTEPSPVELHYFYDETMKLSGYLVSIHDDAGAGMPHNMARILKSVWNSGRTKAQRINLLSHGVQQIEAFQGVAQVPEKLTLAHRIGRMAVRFFARKGAK